MSTAFQRAARDIAAARTPGEEIAACRRMAVLVNNDLNAVLMGSRLDRQSDVHTWVREAFGDDHAKSVEQRGIRMAEEAIEAAQAAGCNADMLHRLVDHVFSRPVGKLPQEIGGVGVTLLALAQAAGIDADAEEVREFERVLSFPLEHFKKRNAEKNAAGFDVRAAAQGGSRYVVKNESLSAHCCFDASVVDTQQKKGRGVHKDGIVVCKCFDVKDAKYIAAVLNRIDALARGIAQV